MSGEDGFSWEPGVREAVGRSLMGQAGAQGGSLDWNERWPVAAAVA